MFTIKQIDAAKPKDKPYRLLDSNGLYLYVPVTNHVDTHTQKSRNKKPT